MNELTAEIEGLKRDKEQLEAELSATTKSLKAVLALKNQQINDLERSLADAHNGSIVKNNNTRESLERSHVATDQVALNNTDTTEGQFRWTIKNVWDLTAAYIYSPGIMISGMEWRVCANRADKNLQVYLKCNGEVVSEKCNVIVDAKLEILSRLKVNKAMEMCAKFTKTSYFHGFIMPWSSLIDPVKGYLFDESIAIEVNFRVFVVSR